MTHQMFVRIAQPRATWLHQASIVFTVNDSTRAIESANSDLQRIRNPEKTKPTAFWQPNNIFEITGI